MTVWVVTQNGLPHAVAASLVAAHRAMDRLRAVKPADGWRKVGELGWASRTVTSLRAVPMECEAE